MSDKPTLILGATDRPDRYANLAANRLVKHGHTIYPLGNRAGETAGVAIETDPDSFHPEDVHTVTLYMNPVRQEPFHDYILALNPKRIIFNPGTENTELIEKARAQGIEPVIGCTLVMLSAGTY